MYKHVEAFCEMLYGCQVCGYVETIWNSRDGVTPFTTSCRKCGKMTSHIEWDRDRRVVNKIVKSGNRIFIDSTPHLRAIFANSLFEKMKGTEHERPEEEREAFVKKHEEMPSGPISIIV